MKIRFDKSPELGKLFARTLCTALALLLIVVLVPPLSARAEGFTYSITVSGAYSGAVTGSPTYNLMEGQSITLHITSDDEFQLLADTLGAAGLFNVSVSNVSDKKKSVTVTPVNGADFNGNSNLRLVFYDMDQDLSSPTEYMSINTNITLIGSPFITQVTTSPASLTLVTGQTYRLQASADPAKDNNGNDIELVWAMIWNTGCVSVAEDGTVTAISEGFESVYAGSQNTTYNPKQICNITVVNTLPAQSVSVSLADGSAGVLSNGVLTLVEGDSAQLEAAIEPSNSTDTLAWSGGNDAVSVDGDGKVDALKKGNATVTATAGDKSRNVTIRVLEHHDAAESTCTEYGTIEYWEDADGNKYSDAAGATAADDVSAPLKAHTLTKIEAKAATCEEVGSKEHWKCSVCETLFNDANGKNPTLPEAIETAPLGHDWNDGELTEKPSAKEPGEITYTCGRDSSHTKTKEIPAGTDYIKVPDSTYRLGSKKDVVFEITCDDAEIDAYLIDFFEGVKLDGKELKADTDYTYEKGSVKVTLKSSYIEKNITSNGKYKVEAIFSSGTAKGTLKVSSGSGDTPGTGDDTSDLAIVGAALSFVLALVYIAYSIVSAMRRRGSQAEQAE